jgi:hypothetical protein
MGAKLLINHETAKFLLLHSYAYHPHHAAHSFVPGFQRVALHAQLVGLQQAGLGLDVVQGGLQGRIGESHVFLGEFQRGFLPDAQGLLARGDGLRVVFAQGENGVERLVIAAVLIQRVDFREQRSGFVVFGLYAAAQQEREQ